jgi:hypothetical protein
MKMKNIQTFEEFVNESNVQFFEEFIDESKNIDEAANSDMIDRNLRLLDAAADMAIKNPKVMLLN